MVLLVWVGVQSGRVSQFSVDVQSGLAKER